MFKWSKSRRSSGEPTTPKMAFAPLPDSGGWRGSPVFRASPSPEKPSKYSFFGRLTPDRRSATPHPGPHSSHRSKEAHVPRLRTVSMSKHDDDVVLWKLHKTSPTEALAPTKPMAPDPDIQKPSIPKTTPKYLQSSVPSLPMKGGACKVDHPEQCSGPLKSAMKGGAFQTSTALVKHEFPSLPLERRPSSKKSSTSSPREYSGKPPRLLHSSSNLSNCQATSHPPRSRSHSLTEHRPGYTTSEQTPKYMKAYIKEVALKDEAVALSWPLIDFASRRNKGMPALYFDIGFDPRKDQWAVRAHRGGFSSPLTREECEIPVSPHVFLTEMVITCNPPLAQWPVHVRRSRGLRCIDVFRAIFDTYNIVLTEKEKAQIGEEYWLRCERAFKQRCADSPGLPLYNERCGMRRVDLLRGRRIFRGLSPLSGSTTHWILHFDDSR